MQQAIAQTPRQNERLWAGPTQTSPLATWCHVLPAFCPQIAPIGPFLPIVPVRKCHAVYKLGEDCFHGMEEVHRFDPYCGSWSVPKAMFPALAALDSWTAHVRQQITVRYPSLTLPQSLPIKPPIPKVNNGLPKSYWTARGGELSVAP